MTCHEFWNAMPDLADGAEPADHLRECPSCAALVDRHRALAAGLRQMAGERHRVQAPPEMEARLVAAFRSQAGRPVAAGSRLWMRWAAAAAAVVVVSIFLVRGRAPQSAQVPDPGGVAAASAAVDVDPLDSDFIPLPYGSSTAAMPSLTEDADLVRVEVPRSTLVALGIPVPVGAGAGRVEAVMALGGDGMLEGVRILQ